MTTTTATFDRSPVVEDAVAAVSSTARDTGPYVAVGSHTAAPLGARQDAVPQSTPAVRGVERDPAHRRARAARAIVMG